MSNRTHTASAQSGHDGSTSELITSADVLHRWFVWINRISIALLIVAIAAQLSANDVSWLSRLVGLVLALALAIWHVVMIGENSEPTRRRASWYLALAIPIVMLLFQLHPAFKLLAFTSFWTTYAILQSFWLATVPAALISLALMVQVDRVAPQELITDPGFVGAFILTLLFGGLLSLAFSSIVRQSDRQRELIQQLAATRSELARNEREAGKMAERQRLAGDIHDTIAQDLTSIVLHLENARSLIRQPEAQVSEHLDIAITMARSGLAEARQIVHALLPGVLVGRRITDALRDEIRSWQTATGIPATFQWHGADTRLPADAEITLLRVLQESLTNVRKHANATQVTVTMSYLEDEVILDIRDNGEGMEPWIASGSSSAPPGAQVGLRSMRDRLEAVHGSLTVETAPGEGLTIAASIPVQPDTV